MRTVLSRVLPRTRLLTKFRPYGISHYRFFCSKEPIKVEKTESEVDKRNKVSKTEDAPPIKKFDPYYKWGIPREYLRLGILSGVSFLCMWIYFYLKAPELGAEQRDRIMHFFAKLNADPDVVVTYTGLMYRIVRETPMGDEDSKAYPSSRTDTALINYRGRFMDGRVFDSTFNDSPCSFNLPDILDGLSQGISMMKPGDLYEFYIPDHLAYAAFGSKFIPPYEPLIFEVELLDFWETPQSDNVYVKILQKQNVRLPGS